MELRVTLAAITPTVLARSVIVVLGALILFDAFVPGFGQVPDIPADGDISPAWLALISPLIYVLALWFLTALISPASNGETFGRLAVRNLRVAGGLLLLGSWTAIILEPSVGHLIANQFVEMAGVRFAIEMDSAVLFVLGLLLIMLAGRGSQLKEQLDSFV